MLDSLKADVQSASDPVKAKFFAGFFKTRKGEYGENDVFQIGIIYNPSELFYQIVFYKNRQFISMPVYGLTLMFSRHKG